jgi:hypothetical protein
MGGEQINKCSRINNEEKNPKAIKSNLFPKKSHKKKEFTNTIALVKLRMYIILKFTVKLLLKNKKSP